MKIVKEVPERFITTHSFQHKESSVQYDTFYAMWNINKARRVKGIPSWSHVQCFQWTKPLDAMFLLQTNLNDRPAKIRNRQDKKRIWGKKWMLKTLLNPVCLQVVGFQTHSKWSRVQVAKRCPVSQIRVNLPCLGRCLQSHVRKCVSEIIDEKMCHFLWDTPVLMICQILHTAEVMFC